MTTHDPNITPPIYGAYQCHELLGQGGMGVVWLAQHVQTQQWVALKTLQQTDAKLLSRFRRESRMLQRLKHPGIVRWLDEGVDEHGTPWYTMSLLKGQTLLWHMRAQNPSKPLMPTPSTANALPPQQASWGASTHWLTRLSALQSEHGQIWSDSTITASDMNRRLQHDVKPAHAHTTHQPHTRSWPDDTLTEQLQWIGQLCQTLAFVHGEGVVHCDLKPENIFITEDGDAILVDFGIADDVGARIEQEVLEAAGLQAGTTHYISPEQIQGQWVDARTDLYSLGCILFEVLIGRVPYRDRQPSNVLRQHLSTPIPELDVPNLPAGLAQMVRGLLAKAPSQRIGHAQIVISILKQHQIDIKPWRDAPTAQHYLYRPRFTGRFDLLESLERKVQRQLDDAATPKTHVVLLGGESGVGKSRLAAELIAQFRQQPIEVYHGQGQWLAQEQNVGHPLHVMRPVLRQLADRCLDDPQRAEHWFGARGKLLHRFAPFLEDLPGQRDHVEPGALPLTQARLRLFDTLASILETSAEDRPILLVLDDLHWADRLSLAFIDYLITIRPQDHHYMILGMYRTESLPYQLALLRQNEQIDNMRLVAMHVDEARQLIEEMLGMQHVPDVLLEYVYTQTEGNPYFIAEYLRLMLDESLLGLDEDGIWALKPLDERMHIEQLHVPETIQTLVRDRLTRLPAGAQQVCQAAAILGRSPRMDRLMSMVSLKQDELLNWLEVLDRREVLEKQGKRVHFKHDKLREAALGSMDDEQRQRLHRQAAELYQLVPQTRVELGRLGYHWEHAGEHARAYDHYIEDVQRALATDALETASELLVRAIDIMADPRDEQAHQTQLALIERAWLTTQDYTRAQNQLEHLSQQAKQDDRLLLRAKTQTLLGELYHIQGDTDRAIRTLGDAMARFEQFASGQGQADVLLNLAKIDAANAHQDQDHDSPRWSKAKSRCDEAYTIYRRLKDIRGQARALEHMGKISFDRGRIREAQSSFELAMDLHERLKNSLGRAQMMTQIGWMHWELGSFKQAKKITQQALNLCRGIGYTTQEFKCLLVLAGVAQECHQDDDARQWMEQAQRKAQYIDDATCQADLLLVACHQHRVLRQWRQCEEDLEHLYRLKTQMSVSQNIIRLIERALHADVTQDQPKYQRLHRTLKKTIEQTTLPRRARVTRAVKAYQRLHPL